MIYLAIITYKELLTNRILEEKYYDKNLDNVQMFINMIVNDSRLYKDKEILSAKIYEGHLIKIVKQNYKLN